jgi:hypothetical protein
MRSVRRLFVVVATIVALTAVGLVPSVAAASPRSGHLHVTKECSAYTGLANSYCTITSSNLKAIAVGSEVVYASPAGATSLNSDIVLDDGAGNTEFGHCYLDFGTGLGLCTFWGGTGNLTGFQATAYVSHLGNQDSLNWAWKGMYSFSPAG